MKAYSRQQGVTMITIVLGLLLLAFFVLIVVTLFPVYMEHFNVRSHIERIGHDARSAEMTKQEVRSTLLKRFGIDDVKNVKREDILITDLPDGGYQVEVDYEVRKPFMSNVDVVVYFSDTVEIK